jgi:hypothetical protein
MAGVVVVALVVRPVPMAIHHHLLLLLLLLLQHELLLSHGVPGCGGSLQHLSSGRHATATACVAASLVEPWCGHALYGTTAATTTATLLHHTHVWVVTHRHAHGSAAHLPCAVEADTTHHVRPHHGLLRQHPAHRPADTDGAVGVLDRQPTTGSTRSR